MTQTQTKQPETPRRLLLPAEVQKMVGFKTTSLYLWVKAGTFPAPIKIGKFNRWIESEVQEWIDKQITATRGEPAAA